MSNIISASALTCEKILREEDGVISAIRIVDLFTVSINPNIPIEQQPVQMSLLIRVMLAPNDSGDHRLSVKLVRPDGEVAELGTLFAGKIETQYPGTPIGLTLNAGLQIVPRQEGTHYAIAVLDGDEVVKTGFTLRKTRDGDGQDER